MSFPKHELKDLHPDAERVLLEYPQAIWFLHFFLLALEEINSKENRYFTFENSEFWADHVAHRWKQWEECGGKKHFLDAYGKKMEQVGVRIEGDPHELYAHAQFILIRSSRIIREIVEEMSGKKFNPDVDEQAYGLEFCVHLAPGLRPITAPLEQGKD